MASAVAALYLILATGLDQLALATVVATCVLTTVSVTLFGGGRSPNC